METVWEHNGVAWQGGEITTIFLPGWGFDGRVLGLVSPRVDAFFPLSFLDPAMAVDSLISLLESHGIERVNLIGWSLGANLAFDFACAYPERVASLSLLAMRQSWPEEVIAGLRHDLLAGGGDFLKGFYRKCFLGHKADYARFAAELQNEYLARTDVDLLLRGLDYLGAWQLPENMPACPTQIWHGRKDIVAPVEEMIAIPNAQVHILEHCGHAVFLDGSFIVLPEARKSRIRQRFSKAAVTYDAHADVQKELAQALAQRLPAGFLPDRILEIGTGTGNFTAILANAFPAAQITSVDFAEGMLAVARNKVPRERVRFVCQDGERFLAECAERFDLICSNATMQWFDAIDQAFARIQQILKAGGFFVAAVFGPGTLQELGSGLALVFEDNYLLPASRFPTGVRLNQIVADGFFDHSVEKVELARNYDSLLELLDHIRKTGTGGGQQLPAHLTRGRLRSLEKWFLQEYGTYPVTYQAFIIRGRR